jgi:two-component system sensor histidine kinase/response regulator
MDDFLVKPYDEAQIADMLGRWLTPLPVAAADAKAPDEEEAPSSSVTPLSLDKRTVEHIRRIAGENGSSLLSQVASQFAANAGPQMTNLRAAARDGDPEAVWRAAHSLRSSAGAIGAYRVAQHCGEIEALARDNGILPTEAAFAALDSELAAATRDLKELTEAEAAAPDRRGSSAI